MRPSYCDEGIRGVVLHHPYSHLVLIAFQRAIRDGRLDFVWRFAHEGRYRAFTTERRKPYGRLVRFTAFFYAKVSRYISVEWNPSRFAINDSGSLIRVPHMTSFTSLTPAPRTRSFLDYRARARTSRRLPLPCLACTSRGCRRTKQHRIS